MIFKIDGFRVINFQKINYQSKIRRKRDLMKKTLTSSNYSIGLAKRYQAAREQTVDLCRHLEIEDFAIQGMVDVSPPKWHLAHTTWFFENFALSQFIKNYSMFHPQFNFLFNSYYESVGKFHLRQNRGLLSRPSTEEIFAYRIEIDRRMLKLIEGASLQERISLDPIIEIGIQHEQQHQELLLTDIKYNFYCNPLKPVYRPPEVTGTDQTLACQWMQVEGGTYSIGFDGKGFAYDNEKPKHRVLIRDFEIASRLVTNGEYLAFIEDGGYDRPEFWLSDGWKDIQDSGRKAPIYWENHEGTWRQFTFYGSTPLIASEPVCHVSFYEAAAFARWAGMRLPTEHEWEAASRHAQIEEGNFLETGCLQPRAAAANQTQLYGDVWEWTQSPYAPYPGYYAPLTAIGEYNGKFMCNQFVLRGGSCLTSKTHIRPTYRNFFYPSSCWQCTGIRLVKEKKKHRSTSLLSTKTLFLQDVVKGLTQTPKTLSPKYFYNKKGSELFDKICELPEYYITRTETHLLEQAIRDLKNLLPPSSAIIEYGSGSCEKIGRLLKQITQIQSVVLIDISQEFIQLTAKKVKNTFPHLSVHPLAVDFLKLTSLPEHRDLHGKYPVVFFPGSTIGNFESEVCQELLHNIAELVGLQGGLLIGVDLIKDQAILEAAYNDKAGVTAAFNLNLLHRINQELGGNFPIEAFEHRAFFNPQKERIEMHLECQKECLVSISGQHFTFKRGETIHTENSHKFALNDFRQKGEQAGFALKKQWVDSKGYFGLLYFTRQ